ncbi:MAG: RHS repeat-associated core domain-containing protein, partial [Pirellulales bacterium]|nr:RHS repeat-associated core domain-containing protein [Pirellulales bacterium]
MFFASKREEKRRTWRPGTQGRRATLSTVRSADHQGTVRDVAEQDGVTGETRVVDHRRYDAGGKLVDRVNPAGGDELELSAFEPAYTGRPLDEAIGLYNYRARWYDAALSRFVSEDPIGLAGGDPNLYRYCGNDLMNAVDPSGLWSGSSDSSFDITSPGGPVTPIYPVQPPTTPSLPENPPNTDYGNGNGSSGVYRPGNGINSGNTGNGDTQPSPPVEQPVRNRTDRPGGQATGAT